MRSNRCGCEYSVTMTKATKESMLHSAQSQEHCAELKHLCRTLLQTLHLRHYRPPARFQVKRGLAKNGAHVSELGCSCSLVGDRRAVAPSFGSAAVPGWV